MHELITSIKLAFGNLRSNLARTFLSLLGIVIGVAAVILVLSLGAGVKEFVVSQVESFGTDIFEIEVKVPNVSKTSAQNAGGQVGGMQITTFKIEDAEKVAGISNVSAWYAAIMSQQVISRGSENKQSIIMGVTSGAVDVDAKMEIDEGHMFSDEDDKDLKQSVVLGSEIKKSFFENESAIGKDIKIKGQTYKVVGTLKDRGATGFFNFDNVVYMPLRTLQKKIMGVEHLQFAIFKLKDISRLDVTILDATDVMRGQHNIKDPDDDDFAVTSIAEATDILDKVFSIITLLLLALTSISLVVGGVGIMNVMFVSVTERTFEIGLKKAIGAKNSDVLKQFLFEAIFLTFLGGVLGIIIGLGISKIAEYLAMRFGYFLSFPITLESVLIGVGFSLVTGIVFGLYPAKKASQMSPMEALRKE